MFFGYENIRKSLQLFFWEGWGGKCPVCPVYLRLETHFGVEKSNKKWKLATIMDIIVVYK